MKRLIAPILCLLVIVCLPSRLLAIPQQIQANNYKSCWQILLAGASSGSGVYTIDPDGTSGNAPFDVYCDMTTDGGGWTHVITAGNSSVLVDGAVGSYSSSAFKLSNSVINSLLDSERLILINFGSGKIMELKLGRGAFTTASQAVYFRHDLNAEFKGLCTSSQEYGAYWFFVKAGCSGTYPNQTCTCQSSNYENGVYSVEGFNNRDSSSFWPATGWSANYKVYVRESRMSGQIIGKGTAYGLEIAKPAVNAFINGQVLSTVLTEPLNHVIMTYNKDGGNGNLKLYVNGSVKTARTLTDPIATNNETLRIGNGFSGIIDDVAVYSSALTDAEVRQRYDRVTEGLAAKWPFNTGYGPIAYDLAGNVNNGTLKNGTKWVHSSINDQFENWEDLGNALLFDGVDDYVEAGANSVLTSLTPQNITIEAWVYNTRTITPGVVDLRTIVAQRPDSSNSGFGMQYGYIQGYGINNYCVTLTFWGGYGGRTTREILPNRWYHIVGTFQNNVASIYINGQSQAVIQEGTGYTPSSDPIMIGRQGNFATRYDYHQGLLDEVAIYKRALNADEVKRRYERYSWGLVSRWDFDETSGNTVSDSGLGSNPGTLMNAATRAGSTLGSTKKAAPTGNMISFDGNDDYVEIAQPLPSNLRFSRGFTLEAWVRPNAYSNARGGELGGIIASQWDAQSACYSLMIDYRSGAHGGVLGGIHFQVGSSTGYWTTGSQGTTNVALPLNVWSHVMAVADPGYEYTVYLDGQKVTNWLAKNDVFYSDNCHMALGWNQHQSSSLRYFNGSLENVRLYNQPLYAQSAFWKANLVRQSSDPLANIGTPANDATFAVNDIIPFTTSGSSDSYGQNPGIAGYFWDFDDGSAIVKRDSSVAVSYTRSGVKKIKLWAIDNEGNPSQLALGQGLIHLNINPAGTLFDRLNQLKKGKNTPALAANQAAASDRSAAEPPQPEYEPAQVASEPVWPLDLSQLAAAWSFNEASGSNAADSSGKGNTGNVIGARWADSPLNDFYDTIFFDGRSALYFDGSLDYVEVADSTSLDITNQISLEAWVRADSMLPPDLGTPGNPAKSCAVILQQNSAAPTGNYWLDPDGSGSMTPFLAYCDMTTDGGGWTKMESIVWKNFFNDTNWYSLNLSNPQSDWYSALSYRTAFKDSNNCYTYRFIVGNSGNWLSTPAHKTVWKQCHDPFTETTNGSDYTFISGEQSTTCGGFNGFHNKLALSYNYAYTSDVDSNDGIGCWWMQGVPRADYNNSGYLEGYGGYNYHVWDSLWLK